LQKWHAWPEHLDRHWHLEKVEHSIGDVPRRLRVLPVTRLPSTSTYADQSGVGPRHLHSHWLLENVKHNIGDFLRRLRVLAGDEVAVHDDI
jgi:hypothetical protein